MGITIMTGKEVNEIDVTGVEIRIEGTAYDIDRVLQACRETMKLIEFNRLDPAAIYHVSVPPPDHS